MTDDDRRFYLDWLAEYAMDAGCHIHAYVLMANHVHLLLTPETSNAAGRMMKRLGQRYVQYFNRTWKRSGTLWEGRFRLCLAQDDAYVLACYRYIELNPVRAAMVEHSGEYHWSSYGHNAQGRVAECVTPHADYLGLGPDGPSRQSAYRELFRYRLDPTIADEIRGATNGNYALGTQRFREEVEAALQRRASRGQAGRPRQANPPASGDLFSS